LLADPLFLNTSRFAPAVGNILLLVLATWRLSSLLVFEDGPFEVFARLRRRVGIIQDPVDPDTRMAQGFFAELLSCVWCASFWVIIPMVALWWALPEAVAVLAIWGGAVLIERWVDGRR